MPLYKFVGNRILTTMQNRAARHPTCPSSTAATASTRSRRCSALPFQLNSNDFHFDTEIIIQLLNAGLRIVELPIPTYYGDEICRVNGMKYAKDVIAGDAAERRCTASGLLYQRRFDPRRAGQHALRPEARLREQPQLALDAVPPGATVLDIGAGPGGMARRARRRRAAASRWSTSLAPAAAPTADVKVLRQDLDDAADVRRRPATTTCCCSTSSST